MKKFLIFVFALCFTGCAAWQEDSVIEEAVELQACAEACAEQQEITQERCVELCKEAIALLEDITPEVVEAVESAAQDAGK